MSKIKPMINQLLVELKIKIRIISNRCPRRFKVFIKPLTGGIIGALAGGIAGFFIGVLLGYFLGELFFQTFRNKQLAEYLENPGSQQINEGEAGTASWCALGILIASANYSSRASDPEAANSPAPEEKILKQVFLQSCYVFNNPLLNLAQIEHFSQAAWQKRNILNPDLLAESFAARRYSFGDAKNLARGFTRLAENEKAKNLAKEIILVIDPYYKEEQVSSPAASDPWKILGLKPGTPIKEIKTHYRQLAKLFHPDNLEVLDKNQQETAAQAFVAIKEAYLQVTKYPSEYLFPKG